MKTILQVNRPYVHGSLTITCVDESRARVQSFSLTVNAVPVIIEGVLVREGDVWRFASFGLQRATQATHSRGHGRGCGYWSTSRRNQERAREVILDVVSTWAGAPPPKPQPLRVAAESDEGLLAELLA